MWYKRWKLFIYDCVFHLVLWSSPSPWLSGSSITWSSQALWVPTLSTCCVSSATVLTRPDSCQWDGSVCHTVSRLSVSDAECSRIKNWPLIIYRIIVKWSHELFRPRNIQESDLICMPARRRWLIVKKWRPFCCNFLRCSCVVRLHRRLQFEELPSRKENYQKWYAF